MEGADPQIVFAGGGTGGHLFPALAVADELRRRLPSAGIGFVGSRNGLETRLVPQAGYPLWPLPLAGLKGRGVVARAGAAAAAGLAVLRCAWRFLRPRPGLVIGVGGFASGPAVLAARTIGVPTLVLEQNHQPGATNRWLAPRVDAVCLPSEAALQRIGGRRFVTGNPVRPEFAALGPAPNARPVSLLVFGGSRGARSLNRAVCGLLPRLAGLDDPPRVVHQSGPDDEREVRDAYACYPDGRWEVHPFLDDMPARFGAADLIVARAGATTVAELAAARRAAILVPYPHAADDHQRVNAAALADAGAARVVLDPRLGDELFPRIAELVADPAERERMARAAGTLAYPRAAQAIADIAQALLRGEPPAEVERV